MIKLSLCMIVKNEEKVISRCLDSVAGRVDEIIIADTGSTDKTKEICRQYTDKIYDFEWIDDFSAARNFSFSKASGDYIMWLDADDVVTPPNAEKLSKLKEKLTEVPFDVIMCRYYTAFDENGAPTFSFFRERILKRSANFKWEGFIHECITPCGKIEYSDFAVEHKKLESSRDRNLRIFQRKISAGEKLSGRNAFYYGRELFYNNMFVEGAAMLEHCLKTGAGINFREACLFLSDCYSALGDNEKAFQALCRSFEFKKPRADILCKLAALSERRGDFDTAIFWYKAAMECGDESKNGEFDRSEYRDLIPLIELTYCYFHAGKLDQAIDCHEKAKAIRPNHPSVIFNEKYFKEKKQKKHKKVIDKVERV